MTMNDVLFWVLLCGLGAFCLGVAVILIVTVVDFMFFMPARILHVSALHAAEQYRKQRGIQ